MYYVVVVVVVAVVVMELSLGRTTSCLAACAAHEQMFDI